jgi:hypothetical protein
MWAPMPDPPENFLRAEIDFNLPLSEAELLVDHIRRSHPASLLAEMCSAPSLAADARFPWDLSIATFPQELKDVLHHAQCFSELTIGPQHVYNVLLARKARIEFEWDTVELESNELNHLAAWAELVRNRYAELRSWVDNLPDFWALVEEFNTVSGPTQTFVNIAVRHAVADPVRFVEHPTIHSAIANRELRLKTTRALLSHRSALENWNQAPFGGQLNYRWPVTRSYLTDIAAALAGSS